MYAKLPAMAIWADRERSLVAEAREQSKEGETNLDLCHFVIASEQDLWFASLVIH